MRTATDTLADLLAKVRAQEFDVPFRIYPLGTFEGHVSGVYAPSVWHSYTEDIEIDSDAWEPLTGYTGQHGYRGACMHASEDFGPGMVADMWEAARDAGQPVTFVTVVIECYPTDDDPDPEPAGWAILRHID